MNSQDKHQSNIICEADALLHSLREQARTEAEQMMDQYVKDVAVDPFTPHPSQIIDQQIDDLLNKHHARNNTMNEIRQLRAAVWIVGNMDTEHDKAAWWRQFGALWHQAAREHGVQAQQDADAMWRDPPLPAPPDK